ncbi:MAG: BamA/TamA family outer membrane protein [Candidatus Omnitrophica bacterium]|nr:BamA/TamA family outer membrane protein [Candidatus Omnitrophota bacterium]
MPKVICRSQRVSFIFVALMAFLLAVPSAGFAEKEIGYDPYLSVLKYPEANQIETVRQRDRNQLLARILEQPIRPAGYVLGRTAEWVERKHVDDKAIWLFDELASRGVYPSLKTPTEGGFGAVGIKGRVELEKLFQFEQPYLSVDVSGGWTPNKDFAGTSVELGGHYRLETPSHPFFHEGAVRYQRSSSESFYGIGQDTSLGEWSVYQPEELRFESALGSRLTRNVESEAAFVYQRMNIGNGARERVGKIKEHFPVAGIPGVNGGDLIGLVTRITHDTRDQKSDPREGGQESLAFSYFHDVDGNDFQYLKVAGSVSHFFSIFSDRRILALRVAAEKNQELGGESIPFFNLARLGGSDIADGSELLRSYRYNRFFDEGLVTANVEYRYNVYQYGDFGTDAFLLFDVGEVFEEIGDFGFDELKFSYGGGFNLKFRRRTLVSCFIARGSEGWKSGLHTKLSF